MGADAYFAKQRPVSDGLQVLRGIVLRTELIETVKWGGPCYVLDQSIAPRVSGTKGKAAPNVLSIAAFKSYFGMWFHQGVFLTDPAGVLVNAQSGRTKGMRQLRFQTAAEINPELVEAYVDEAIAIAKSGRQVDSQPRSMPPFPEGLQAALDADPSLAGAFAALTPGRQREYLEHIAAAKRAETRDKRIAKALPLILQGIGLHDRYRKPKG